MKKYINLTLRALLIVPAFALSMGVLAAPMMPADNVSALGLRDGADSAQGEDQASDIEGQGGIFQQIVNILLFLIGAVAVIMLVIGGFRYVISGGDQSQVTSAKNTILYAIVGIVVAFLAYAAVNFVLNNLSA